MSRKLTLLIAVPFTVVALLVASWVVWGTRATAEPTCATPPIVEYQEMVEGWTFQLALECAPESGSWWRVADINPAITHLLKQELVTTEDGQGQQVIEFQAVAPGSSIIRLHSVRPGENDRQALKCYEFHISVVPASDS